MIPQKSMLVLEAGMGWVYHALNGGFIFASAEPATYLPGLLWTLVYQAIDD